MASGNQCEVYAPFNLFGPTARLSFATASSTRSTRKLSASGLVLGESRSPSRRDGYLKEGSLNGLQQFAYKLDVPQRMFRCEHCSFVADRDWNAAKNLERLAKLCGVSLWRGTLWRGSQVPRETGLEETGTRQRG